MRVCVRVEESILFLWGSSCSGKGKRNLRNLGSFDLSDYQLHGLGIRVGRIWDLGLQN